MPQAVVLKVGMSCQGCVGAVTRVLAKLEGVESFNVDIEAQKVTVNTNLEPQFVMDKVSKTGKKTEFWKDGQVPATPAVEATETVTVVTEDTEALSAAVEPKETVEVAPAEVPPPAPPTAEAAPTPASA